MCPGVCAGAADSAGLPELQRCMPAAGDGRGDAPVYKGVDRRDGAGSEAVLCMQGAAANERMSLKPAANERMSPKPAE
eukprot:242499-Chlamydomonas_euryale.AAC.1